MPKKMKRQRITNSQGKIFYGMHFYPGIATARPNPDKPEIKVFLNSSTIRKMDKSFTGKPIFVLHVDSDEISENVDELRKDADGWVVESFYNAADGKHWAKLMIVSKRGMRAIERGYRLSNCYVPKAYRPRGIWNGVTYDREVTDGEYEHMAIVPNPRYDESVILTPEQFHAYNESQDREIELTRLANERERRPVKLSIFTRKKVENAIDLKETLVQLPRSGKEVSLAACVKNADDAEMRKKKPQLANADDLVESRGKKMTVASLLQNYDKMCDELADFKAASEEDTGDDFTNEDEEGDEVENEDDIGPEAEDVENADDESEDADGDDEIDNEDVSLEADEDDGEVEATAKKKADARKLENSRRPAKKAGPKLFIKNAKGEFVPAPAAKTREEIKRRVVNAAHKPKKKAVDDRTPEQIANAKERAKRVREARERHENGADDGEIMHIETAAAQVARGIARYG